MATLRGVDVFSGKRVRKFFRDREPVDPRRPPGADEIDEIYEAAERALPPGSVTPAPGVPV